MQPVGLQEWIHKLEEGAGVKYIRLGLFFLALLGLAALWHIREAKNFSSMDAMDSAQLARNIAEGRGYTTHFIRPISIAVLAEQRVIVNDKPREVIAFRHPFIENFFLGERGQRAMELLREYPFAI